MRLQFSFWDGRTRAKIVTFTRTDASRNAGSKVRLRGRDEITDKSEAAAVLSYYFRLDHASPRSAESTTRSLLEKTCRRVRPDDEP